MKEFIEKLKSKLKEKLLEYINKANDEMTENGHTLDFENFLGHKKAYENVLYEIVNQLAEEYINTSTDISTDTSTTNADAIRSMTDEELAEFLCKLDTVGITPKSIWNGEFWIDEGEDLLNWLQSEVEGSE